MCTSPILHTVSIWEMFENNTHRLRKNNSLTLFTKKKGDLPNNQQHRNYVWYLQFYSITNKNETQVSAKTWQFHSTNYWYYWRNGKRKKMLVYCIFLHETKCGKSDVQIVDFFFFLLKGRRYFLALPKL